jgi:steroid 5-alpha reductase family enzyme
MTWMGFIIAMVGDFTKTIVKARKGPDHLVTEGVFCILRHPNYVGEWLGWTSSGLLAVLCGASQWGNIASILGVLGIDLVLIQATTALEAKQREKYGQSESYQKWVKRSWAGFTIKTKGEGEASTATDNVESSKK